MLRNPYEPCRVSPPNFPSAGHFLWYHEEDADGLVSYLIIKYRNLNYINGHDSTSREFTSPPIWNGMFQWLYYLNWFHFICGPTFLCFLSFYIFQVALFQAAIFIEEQWSESVQLISSGDMRESMENREPSIWVSPTLVGRLDYRLVGWLESRWRTLLMFPLKPSTLIWKRMDECIHERNTFMFDFGSINTWPIPWISISLMMIIIKFFFPKISESSAAASETPTTWRSLKPEPISICEEKKGRECC